MAQLSFSFQNNSTQHLFREEDFVLLDENSAMINFLHKFFAQDNFSQSGFTSLIINGAKSSGKTHLLHIFAKKFNVDFLSEEKISQLNLANFFVKNKFYICENIDEFKNEELLLHLINSASEARSFLIITTSNRAKFKLKDLSSRLKNIFTTEIKNPTIMSVKQLLANGFARRQMKLSGQIINFIADNIERSYEAVFSAIKMVEAHCQESGKNIAMLDVKKMFKK